MQAFELTILGSSSATPTSKRNPSSQLLTVAGRYFLIDCGEATQIQLRKFKISFQRIDHIFISHLHGDHIYGLPGLLSSMHLLGRKNTLNIYSPPHLNEILNVLHKYSGAELGFRIIFHELDSLVKKIIFEDECVTVETIPLKHRVPCCGFLFSEKPLPRNIIREKLAQYSIPIEKISGIKKGDDLVTAEGKTISNCELTSDPPAPRSYAYCSDTCYDESLIGQLKGTDLLYHEATFAEDMIDRAKATFHSTARDAGTIAEKAGVKKLIIGHYSARYHELETLLQESRSVFSNTVLAIEGEKHVV